MVFRAVSAPATECRLNGCRREKEWWNHMEISKKDWKLFSEKLADSQENYMDKLTKEYIDLLSDENKNASDKFWELEKRIKQDKKHPGVIMEMSKSEAIWNIVYLIRLGVIEYHDLADFSDDLKQAVKMILDRNRG